MAENSLHPQLKALCKTLDSISEAISIGGGNNINVMSQIWGWNYPSVTFQDLSRAASSLSETIKERRIAKLDEDELNLVQRWQSNLEKLQSQQTLQHLWNGHGQTAAPVYLATMSRLREDLEPLLGWQGIQDANLLPPKLARRLRSYQAQLDEITPNKEVLAAKIKLITEATEAAESLPTDLEALKAARMKVAELQNDALLLHQKITERLNEAEAASKTIANHKNETSKLVVQCEQAYQITTTKGLAAAFDQRARTLGQSMWIWVFVLVGALSAGYLLGSERLKILADIINASAQQKVTIWPNALLAVVSLGAPIWLAWMATKQISQRFRLAEDYAFKASVAKAYEGYRKEANRIDKALEARLFASALTRLEEAPLRLVEGETPGSPWHELLDSEAFREALRIVPGLKEQVKKLRKKPSSEVPNGDNGEGTSEQPQLTAKR